MCRQGNEARALVGKLRQYVEKVARPARQSVEARHHERVALVDLFEGLAEPHAVGLRAARRLLENLLGSGGAQLPRLRISAPAVRRYPRIAVNHGFILHQTSATEKPLNINSLFL
jgi:hypothetical protein